MSVTIKQFHYCNAYTRTCVSDDLSVRWVELVSYCTPVCRLYYHGADRVPFGIVLGRCAKCSASTWRQVTRFVHEFGSIFDGVLSNDYRALHPGGWTDVDFDVEYFDNVDSTPHKCNRPNFDRDVTYKAWRSFTNGYYRVEGMHK